MPTLARRLSCTSILFIFTVAMLPFQTSHSDDFTDIHENWQLKRLMHPTKNQLSRELHQQVFIYIGLMDKDVNRAMDLYFDRIESIMLANVIVTDDEGNPKLDPETGAVMTEEDGC